MGTTIEKGCNFATITTSKLRFTKGPGQIQEGAGASVSDQVTLGQAPAASAQAQSNDSQSGIIKFRDLDATARSEYKNAVKDLASNGRLFVREENGSLRRADPVEIKERLDQALPIELVSRVADESSTSGHSSAYSSSKERGFISEGWNVARDDSSHSASQRVYYSTSAFSEWDSLDFASAGDGVTGVAVLPASGNSVVISHSFESDWSSRANRQWGFFTEKNTHSSASGFTRENYRAD